MILEVLLTISVAVNIIIGFVAFRFSKRLFELDDLFDLFSHDIDTNVKYIKELQSRGLFEANEEVMQMHKNINIIAMRLEEFQNRMKEQTGKVEEEVDE